MGWAVGDPRWLAPARTVHAFAVTAAAAPCQRAALALLEASGTLLPEGRREIAARWEALAASWQEHFGEVLAPPSGAFYHWMALPPGSDPMTLCLRLRDEAKVVLVPGTAFGRGGSHHARLSFAAARSRSAKASAGWRACGAICNRASSGFSSHGSSSCDPNGRTAPLPCQKPGGNMEKRTTPMDFDLVTRELAASGLKNIGQASIREVKKLIDNIEKATGERFVRMEMGIPGLPPMAVGVEAQIAALRKGVAALYPDIQGIRS